MRGLDYRWLAALDAVIDQQSFERAAEQLCITQSAVSQRIKQLEKLLAQPLLIRGQPPKLTDTGQKLLMLYQKVRLLEQETFPEFSSQPQDKPLPVSLAVNADSLATWFLPAITPLLLARKIEINLQVEDETRTLIKLRKGEVVGSLSTQATPMTGCNSAYLGDVDYICVASPEFMAKYFSKGVDKASLRRAPAVAFDQHDAMHQQYVHEHFGLELGEWSKHIVRSSEAFVYLAKKGVAYSLIPKIQIESELASGELVEVYPGKMITRSMYWHHWALESETLSSLSEQVIQYGRQVLQK
ncbi:LysR family transcriptional regulator ArgP [Vibrio sp. Of7-15]|uniref:LysR family transcriptional regulator ArgP n=1 Tax=Vibrio sp. Of7-15 TaxID=2724879 RepID=UPI001EF2F86C|nr:LysR family transcriptional regulator ArgP [Vibrio sp. Of7-15]